jgi:hypothetical protein
MRRTASYSRLAMPWHLEHFLMGSIFTGEGGGAFFSLGRTAREEPFVEGDKALVGKLLLSHLTRSMLIHQEVAAIRGANAVLASVMYQAPTGLVIRQAGQAELHQPEGRCDLPRTTGLPYQRRAARKARWPRLS